MKIVEHEEQKKWLKEFKDSYDPRLIDGVPQKDASLLEKKEFISRAALRARIYMILDSGNILWKYQNEFQMAILDDFNMPKALAVFYKVIIKLKGKEKPEDILVTALNMDSVLGLGLINSLEDPEYEMEKDKNRWTL